MSRVIKVEDQVYDRLDQLRDKRETFSDVIKELLDARERILELISVLEGQLKFEEWKREQLQKIQVPH